MPNPRDSVDVDVKPVRSMDDLLAERDVALADNESLRARVAELEARSLDVSVLQRLSDLEVRLVKRDTTRGEDRSGRSLSHVSDMVSEPQGSINKSNLIGLWRGPAVMESPFIREWRKETSKALAEAKPFKFGGKYWDLWKGCVLSTLEMASLQDYVLQEDLCPEDIQVQFKVANHLVRNYLVNNIATEQCADVSRCRTPRDVWKKLLATYENKNIDN